MSSPFIGTPAGTPVAPSTSARYYFRRQIFSRNPVTKGNFTPGQTVNFDFSASGGHYFVPQESRIVAKLVIGNAVDASGNVTSKLAKTVRFACDPVSNMFDQAQISVNGTTVENHTNDVADIARIQLRTEATKAGADGPGSAGLLSFSQKMVRENSSKDTTDINDDDANLLAAQNAFHSEEDRSDKYELLLQSCSGNDLAAGDVKAVELSTPLGQMFTFCRQTKAFLPNMEFSVMLTISSKFREDMFFEQDLESVPCGLVGDGTTVITSAANIGGIDDDQPAVFHTGKLDAANTLPQVYVEDLYLDAMYAVPSVNLPPPTSLQIPYQAVSVYSRVLTPGSSFTEQFTSIPASVGAVIIGMRDSQHALQNNREFYPLAAGGITGTAAEKQEKGIKSLSVSLGSLQLPIPAYQINFPKHQFGRLFADWLSFTGGSASNGVGMDSLTEFAKSPLMAFRILQEPGAYASTLTVRMDTHGRNTDTNTEMLVWCIHQKVFEAFWADGEAFPSKVVVDDVLN